MGSDPNWLGSRLLNGRGIRASVGSSPATSVKENIRMERKLLGKQSG